jgi:hypothetical protein
LRALTLAALGLLVLAHGPAGGAARVLAPTARADPDPSPVAALPGRARILLRGCSERTNERVLLEQVRVELLSAGILQVDVIDVYAQAADYESYDVATLRIDLPGCGESGWNVYLAVACAHTARQTARTLAMSEIPEAARPRSVALGLVELLRSSWRQLAGEPRVKRTLPTPQGAPGENWPDPAPLDPERPPGMAAAPAAPPADPDRSARPRLEWRGATRIYPQTDSGDLATSLSVSQLLAGRVRVHGGGSAAGGGGDGSNVHIFRANSRLGLSLCGASTDQQLGIEVGTVWELGWAQLRTGGSPKESGLLVTGSLEAALRVRVSPGVETLVSLEAGYVLAPLTLEVELDDGRRRSSGLEGSVLGVGIGLAGIL